MDRAIVLGKRPRDSDEIRSYNFTILLPNGTSVNLIFPSERDSMHVKDFLDLVKDEYFSSSMKGKRKIMWKKPDIYFEDIDCPGIKISRNIDFDYFKPDTRHYLKLYDGVKDNTEKFENMWDITPDTEILRELPQEYSFETALADLIDNSLQAVWSNGRNEKRLVSVTINECGLTIFDTGPGMDGSDKNSIVKW
ncbi:hypothetical protein ACHQM5_030726 [Ranunculus cassubicifolius]